MTISARPPLPPKADDELYLSLAPDASGAWAYWDNGSKIPFHHREWLSSTFVLPPQAAAVFSHWHSTLNATDATECFVLGTLLADLRDDLTTGRDPAAYDAFVTRLLHAYEAGDWDMVRPACPVWLAER